MRKLWHTPNGKVWKDMAGMAVSAAKAITSPSCDDETFNARLAACESCEKLKREEDKLYCGACGCPHWRLSELHKKLRFARLKCPLGKWKEADAGQPPTA